MQPQNTSPKTMLPFGSSSSIIQLIWFCVTTNLSSLKSEMLECFSSLMTSKENCVASSWALKGELIECQASSSSFLYSPPCTFGETESTDCHLGDIQKSFVIKNSGNCNCDLILSLEVLSDLTEGDWVSINP